MQDPLDHIARRLRALPQVQSLLETAEAGALAEHYGRRATTDALRASLDGVRKRLLDGGADAVSEGDLLRSAAERLAEAATPTLRRVINATGIVLHTNLGRAPLASEAIAAMADAARGYCNLEYDLETGRRGPRAHGVEALLCELTGAEAAVAVNNGAGAILLALAALAADGEVIVSRGELVEIGGGFRIPDIIRQGGARLVEVGTTNRTRLADYRAAITERTRLVLKVHASNFRIIGFTEEATPDQLAPLCREHGILLVADLGSGDLAGSVRAALVHADVVTFSGDKLLGGPQAGLIAGNDRAVGQVRRHPLLRALRMDKVSLAGLEATLRLHRDAPERIPIARMLAQTEAALEEKAARLVRALGFGDIIRTVGFAGGGALPEERIASRAVAISLAGRSAEALARCLRQGAPPVIGRIVDGRFALDVLAVTEEEVAELAARLAHLP